MKSLILLTLLLTACTHHHNKDDQFRSQLKPIWEKYYTKNFDQTQSINVLVATNRQSKNDLFGCGRKQFDTNFSPMTTFGMCRVSVPKHHIVGNINPGKSSTASNNYFNILHTTSLHEKEWIKNLKKSNRTALIFVHGFNVDYQKALLKTAGIAYDLKYQGPVIAFTWPSGAKDGLFQDNLIHQTYAHNLHNAKQSIGAFKTLLTHLHDQEIKVNVMVHSMGHQVVLPALQELGESGLEEPLINELILNAPDFNTNRFKNAFKDIKKTSKHVTLYCANNDTALIVSKKFNNHKRLNTCLALEGLDSINVSLINNDALKLGHDFYSSKEVLTDLYQVLLSIDPSKRLFIKKSAPFSKEGYFLRQ